MSLLDALAILAVREEEQHGTCIQSLRLCCSQPGVHLRVPVWGRNWHLAVTEARMF